MDNTTFDHAHAVDLRTSAARYRRLARLYPPDVATVLKSMTDDLEAEAEAFEHGDMLVNRLRPAFVPHAVAS